MKIREVWEKKHLGASWNHIPHEDQNTRHALMHAKTALVIEDISLGRVSFLVLKGNTPGLLFSQSRSQIDSWIANGEFRFLCQLSKAEHQDQRATIALNKACAEQEKARMIKKSKKTLSSEEMDKFYGTPQEAMEPQEAISDTCEEKYAMDEYSMDPLEESMDEDDIKKDVSYGSLAGLCAEEKSMEKMALPESEESLKKMEALQARIEEVSKRLMEKEAKMAQKELFEKKEESVDSQLQKLARTINRMEAEQKLRDLAEKKKREDKTAKDYLKQLQRTIQDDQKFRPVNPFWNPEPDPRWEYKSIPYTPTWTDNTTNGGGLDLSPSSDSIKMGTTSKEPSWFFFGSGNK